MNDTEQNSSNTYTSDPEAEANWVIEAFIDYLSQQLDPDQIEQIRQTAAQMIAGFDARYANWIVDDQSRQHLRTAGYVLAAYQFLKLNMPEQDLLSLLREAFTAPLAEVIRQGTAAYLDQSDDPFRAMVDISKTREAVFFGQAFSFERRQDDDRAYLLNVNRCLWHSVFAAEGAPELTPIFCEFDKSWIEAINPEKHGFCFVRPTTLGLNGPMCPFHFYRSKANS